MSLRRRDEAEQELPEKKKNNLSSKRPMEAKKTVSQVLHRLKSTKEQHSKKKKKKKRIAQQIYIIGY